MHHEARAARIADKLRIGRAVVADGTDGAVDAVCARSQRHAAGPGHFRGASHAVDRPRRGRGGRRTARQVRACPERLVGASPGLRDLGQNRPAGTGLSRLDAALHNPGPRRGRPARGDQRLLPNGRVRAGDRDRAASASHAREPPRRARHQRVAGRCDRTTWAAAIRMAAQSAARLLARAPRRTPGTHGNRRPHLARSPSGARSGPERRAAGHVCAHQLAGLLSHALDRAAGRVLVEVGTASSAESTRSDMARVGGRSLPRMLAGVPGVDQKPHFDSGPGRRSGGAGGASNVRGAELARVDVPRGWRGSRGRWFRR